MALQVGTQSDTGIAVRATTLNYNAAYTVLFRVYLPSGSNSLAIWWLSGTTGSNGGTDLGQNSDLLRCRSGGNVELVCFDGTNFANPVGVAVSAGWHSIAIIRTSLSSVRIRVAGTTYSDTSSTLSGRESVAFEGVLGDGDGSNLEAGAKVTNYKSWQSALTDGEVDAEFLTTTVTKSGLFSQSQMSGEASVAGNTSATGSGAAWTAYANLTYGTNDPSVSYGSSAVDLSGSAAAGASASAGLTVTKQLAAAAVANALATGGLSVNKPLTGAAIGRALGSATLTAFSTVWRLPTTAPNGTAVHAIVLNGASPTYSVLAQGTAIVAGGFVDLPGAGVAGTKTFAFVHNYSDNTATTSIRGGPAIATLTSL